MLHVHSKVTFTAIEGEERHGALTNSQGTRRPGGRRGKGCVHLRESSLQGGGPEGAPPFVSGAAHSRGKRGSCGPLPFLGRLQGTTLQCCMASALVATAAAQVALAYMCSCVHGLDTCETQNADYGMPHRTASAAWTAMPSYLPSHSGLTSPSTGAHVEVNTSQYVNIDQYVNTPQYVNITQYTHTCICTCYLN